ncbi:DUF1919 domain-containing protein [Sediminicola arcticus]|jgi:uncharacterized protein (DUF1919 family)|uniref:DUF1919 domain-containing protein n=1 Tax=Sediminicola arcticus TaxID=1574308 RepID=A0ABV2SSN1_9FLAO
MLVDFEIWIKRKAQQYFEGFYSARDIARLKKKDFVIISRNCWGGQIYQWLKLPYNTPFVGLFIYTPCYIKILKNFDYYMNIELKFIEESRYSKYPTNYPIGVLDDVEIHFKHYADKDEAWDKWSRRKERMFENKDIDNYYFSICSWRGLSNEHLNEFYALPFKHKLSFGRNDFLEGKEERHIKLYTDKNATTTTVPNGKKLFKLTFLYLDVVAWLNTGKIYRTRFKD